MAIREQIESRGEQGEDEDEYEEGSEEEDSDEDEEAQADVVIGGGDSLSEDVSHLKIKDESRIS